MLKMLNSPVLFCKSCKLKENSTELWSLLEEVSDVLDRDAAQTEEDKKKEGQPQRAKPISSCDKLAAFCDSLLSWFHVASSFTHFCLKTPRPASCPRPSACRSPQRGIARTSCMLLLPRWLCTCSAKTNKALPPSNAGRGKALMKASEPKKVSKAYLLKKAHQLHKLSLKPS